MPEMSPTPEEEAALDRAWDRLAPVFEKERKAGKLPPPKKAPRPPLSPQTGRSITDPPEEEEDGDEDEEDDEDDFSEWAIFSGFSGEITDKAGRKRCYQDGKQVPCNKQEDKPEEKSRAPEEKSKDPAKATAKEEKDIRKPMAYQSEEKVGPGFLSLIRGFVTSLSNPNPTVVTGAIYNQYSPEIKEDIDGMVKSGLFQKGGLGGKSILLSDKGVTAAVKDKYGFVDGLPPPLTEKAIAAWSDLFSGSSSEAKEKILDALGIEDLPETGSSLAEDFRNHLKAQAMAYHGTKPIHEAIKESPHQKHVESFASLDKGLEEMRTAHHLAKSSLSSLLMKQARRQTSPEEDAKIEELKATTLAQKTSIDNARNDIRFKVREVLRGNIKGETFTVKVDDRGYDSNHTEEEKKTMTAATAWLRDAVARREDGGNMPWIGIYRAGSSDDRAHYNPNTHQINWQENYPQTKVAVHEIAHAIEYLDPSINDAIWDFYKYRVGDEKPQNLSDALPGMGYEGSNERGCKDSFDVTMGSESSGWYMGKQYTSRRTTEVLSMGLEALYDDAPGLARRDPEFTTFLIGLLDGSLRKKKGSGVPKE